jgi:signal transduction histidine kinase
VRARITIGSLLIAAVLVTVALLVVREQVGTILSNADVALAEGDLTPFENDITANPVAEVDNPGTGVLVYVRNPAGSVQVNTLPHDVIAVIANRPAATEQFPFTDDEGRDFIVIGREVNTGAGTWALWSARSTSSSELALAGLDRVLVIGGIVLLIGFGAASWVLATIALRPVARMRKRADALGATLDGDLPVGDAHDELAALATTLNEMLSRVRSSSARERQMVSDAAHELRTPLASLTTQLELAHGDADDAAALAAHLRGAETSVARLSALATNLLELNRLDAPGRAAPRATFEELTTETMGAVDRARMLGLSRSVEVGLEIKAGSIDAYRIDPTAFARLVDNVLVNAINAVPDRGDVAVNLTEDATGLRLAVTDSGPGMPEEFIRRAFERFSRPDAARSGTGSGLGLALVHAIVVDADGDVRLRNTPAGFLVEVVLPKM